VGVARPNSDGRYGILGMSERAAALGGTFDIGPGAASGTRVEVRVPVPA